MAGADHQPMSSVTYLFGDNPPVSVSWQDRVAAAETVDDLVRVANEYLAMWSPAELSRLPTECRPGRLSDAEDVAFYAYTLIRQQCSSSDSSNELHRMAAFFSTVSQRQSQVMAGRPAADEPHSRAS